MMHLALRFFRILCLACALLAAVCLPQGRAVAASSPVRVALLLESPSGDHGYVDNLLQGLEQAKKDMGISYEVFTSPDNADAQEADFLRVAGGGFDLVLTATPPFHQLLMNNAGNFRRVRFGSIDASVTAPNIASVVFADSQGAFLCGFAAATFAARTSTVKTANCIGWVGAFDVAPQRTMLDAFQQGARLADPHIRVFTAFAESYTDAAAGRKAALDLYGRGAVVVMHTAGRAGLGVLQAAKEQQRYAVGMDQDQRGLAPGHVLLSQRKAADKAVYDMVKSVVNAAFPGGETLVMTLENGGVAITPLNQDIPELEKHLAADMTARLNELAYEIRRGSIKLGPPRKPGLCDCL